MFKFKKIKIKNFMSIEDIELDLEKRGLVLIEGQNKSNETFQSNGSGKSGVVNSITYALYGQTSYGLKADDIVNQKVGKGTAVILYFDIDGQSYRIERYRKHPKHKNLVKLFQGNTELTGSSMKETDAKIQQLFGIDYNTYMNSIIQGQGDAEIFSKASDKGKKEILENITNIAIYKKAQEVAKEKVKDTQFNIDTLVRDTSETERQLMSLKDRIDEEKENYKATQESIQETEQKIWNITSELEKHVSTMPTGLEDKLAALKDIVAPRYPEGPTDDVPAIKDRKDKITELQNSLFEKNEKTKERVTAEIQELSGQVGQIEEQVAPMMDEVNVMKHEVKVKQSEINKLDLSDTCPSCGQPIDTAHKEQEFERLTEEIKEKQGKIEYFENTYQNELLPLINNLKDQAQEKEEEFQQIVAERTEEVEEETAKLNQEIADFNQKAKEEMEAVYNGAYNDYQEKIRERDEIQQVKQQYDQKKNNLEYSLQSEKDVLTRLQKLPKPNPRTEELKDIEDKLKELRTLEIAHVDKRDKYEDAVKLFSNSGVRSIVLDLVTPYLNERANEYMATLSGSEIEILFSTQKENKDGSIADKFEVEITNASGGNDYKSNSEGEKKRIDLAISFAIQDLVLSKADMKTNLAVYDECFEGLDEVGSENVIKLLRDRADKVESIFVITHNTHLKTLFENVMTVEKVNGLSRLKEK